MEKFKNIVMKSDADILRSVLGLGPEYVFLYRDKWVIDTFHKLDRAKQRGATELQTHLFVKAIDHLIDKLKSKSGKYLFVSKSTGLGMVVDHRGDRKSRLKGDHLIIVTWLGDVTKQPINKTPEQVTAKNGTVKAIVEVIDVG
jgi:adenosyl cobinamide kinase/adenosyl cobinamide phosphate guanylyltransferase